MSPVLIVAAVVLGVALLVLIIAGAISMAGTGSDPNSDRQLQQTAQLAGLQISRDVMWGTIRGRDVRAAPASTNRVGWCVEVRLDPPLDLGMTLLGSDNDYRFDAEGHMSSVAEVKGRVFQSGDPQLDGAYRIAADEPERLRALFSPELRALLFADLGELGCIRVTDTGCEIRDGQCAGPHWDLKYKTPAELASRIELAVRIVEVLDAARQRIRAAASLRHRVASWRRWIFPASVRRELLEIHHGLGSVQLDDHGLHIDLGTAFDHPEELPVAVQRAAPLLETIRHNAAMGAREGPYR